MNRRNRPGNPGAATSTTTTLHPNTNRRADIVLAVAVLADAGLAVAGRCVDCGHVIVSPVSLARMRGPRCAARAQAVVE